jgi:hypothetical protein
MTSCYSLHAVALRYPSNLLNWPPYPKTVRRVQNGVYAVNQVYAPTFHPPIVVESVQEHTEECQYAKCVIVPMPQHVDILVRDFVHPSKDAAQLRVVAHLLAIETIKCPFQVCESSEQTVPCLLILSSACLDVRLKLFQGFMV